MLYQKRRRQDRDGIYIPVLILACLVRRAKYSRGISTSTVANIASSYPLCKV